MPIKPDTAIDQSPEEYETLGYSSKTGLRKIYYINMNSHDHRRRMQERVGRHIPVPLVRHPAVAIRSLQEAYDDPAVSPVAYRIKKVMSFMQVDLKNPTTRMPKRERFVVSVCLSHFTAYARAAYEHKNDKYGYVLVIEDDVLLKYNVVSKLDEIVASAPANWKMIRLATWGETRQHDLAVASGRYHFYRATQPFYEKDSKKFYYGGAHAVLLKVDGISEILDDFFNQDLTDVDAMETNYPHIPSYAVPYADAYPTVRIVDTNEQSHPPEFDDVSAGLKPAIGGLGEPKDDINGLMYEHDWLVARSAVVEKVPDSVWDVGI